MEIIVISLLLIILILLILISLRSGSNSFLNKLSGIEKNAKDIELSVRNEFHQSRSALNNNFKDSRSETNQNLKDFSDSLSKRVSEIASLQKDQLNIFSNQLIALTKTNEDKFDKITAALESRLKALQDDNNLK